MSDNVKSVDLLEQVLKELGLVMVDAQKADAGNASAAVRARKRIQDAIVKLKETRVVLNANKTKTSKGE